MSEHGNTRQAKACTTSWDRLPPHSLEAEQGVLGCALLAGTQTVDAAREAQLSAAWFYSLPNQLVWTAIEKLDREQKPVDLLSVTQELKDREVLEQVGGIGYVMGLPNAVPSAANLSYYLGMVKEKFQLRRMLSTLVGLQDRVWEWDGKVEDYLGMAADEVMTASLVGNTRRERSIKEIMPDVIDNMETFTRGKQKLRGLSTGFEYFDTVLQGIRHQSYLCLAARPGDGKTAMALNLARYLATDYVWWEPKSKNWRAEDKPEFTERRGIPVAVFSLEMDDTDLVERIVFSEAKVSMGKYNQGFLQDAVWPRITVATGRMSGAPIWVDQSESLSIAEIRSRARRMKREHGIKCFIVDYLQLVQGHPGRRYRDDVERLNDISQGFRLLVKELGVPVIVLAQMNRNMEKAEVSRVPVLGDLKGCGAIEQDAAQVCFLYRPAQKMLVEKVQNEHGAWEEMHANEMIEKHYTQIGLDKTQHPKRLDVYVAKNRSGPTGQVKMLFNRDYVRFEDWHRFEVEAGYKEAPKGERRQAGDGGDGVGE